MGDFIDNRSFSPGSPTPHHTAPNTTASPSSIQDSTMTNLISSLLLSYRTRSRVQSIHHLDERLLADIGLTRAEFRHSPKKKTA
jgi:uncharacterized protein YjiS (DUF1127 family)